MHSSTTALQLRAHLGQAGAQLQVGGRVAEHALLWRERNGQAWLADRQEESLKARHSSLTSRQLQQPFVFELSEQCRGSPLACGAYWRRQNSSRGRPSLAASSLRCGEGRRRSTQVQQAGWGGSMQVAERKGPDYQQCLAFRTLNCKPKQCCCPPGEGPGPRQTAPCAWTSPIRAEGGTRRPCRRWRTARCGSGGGQGKGRGR